MIPRDTTSLKEWANVWSPDRTPRLNSMSIMKIKDHMISLYWWLQNKQERGQRQSSTAISWMVRQLAATCPKDCRQQHHLCCWGYSHHPGTELLPVHGPSSQRILYQPSVQPVHRGQRSSFGGTSVKAVHALLCENSCLHWQSRTSRPAWIWRNH